MLEHVLPIAGAISQSTKQFDDLRVHIVNADVKDSLFTFFANALLNVFLSLLYHFFNARWVNASVDNETL